MEAPYFFHSPLTSGLLTLSREESTHAAGSRRLRAGDELVLVDGRGSAATALVVKRQGEHLQVQVSQVEQRPPTPLAGLTLAAALPKGRRQNYLFEKCAELGVGRILATNFSRSVAQAEPHRLESWTRTVRQAIKQSRQAWAPRVDICGSPGELVKLTPPGARRLLATAGRNLPRIGPTTSGPLDQGQIQTWAVIGPEGGLSEEEQGLFAETGFRAVSLGPAVLRIETACVALACHLQAHLV